jgi:hypothetical protein
MIKGFYYRFRRNRNRSKKYIFTNQIQNNFAYGYRSRRYNKFFNHRFGPVVVIILSIAIVSLILLSPHLIRNTYRVTITNKQVVKHNNNEMHLIYAQTEDGEIRIFENTDNFLELKFNSADLYGAFSINRKYEITAYGFNMPLFSRYQNIVKVRGLESFTVSAP